VDEGVPVEVVAVPVPVVFPLALVVVALLTGLGVDECVEIPLLEEVVAVDLWLDEAGLPLV
jgi:hypothetical protein